MMAGLVFLPDGREWNASSSVFYWALDALAQRAEHPGLVRGLREVADNNLGALDLEVMPADQLAELTGLAQRLPEVGRTELPDTSARDEIVSQLAELAELLAHSGPGAAGPG